VREEVVAAVQLGLCVVGDRLVPTSRAAVESEVRRDVKGSETSIRRPDG